MNLQKTISWVIPIVIFALVSAIYFRQIVFENKSFGEPDNIKARAMQTEMTKYHKDKGEHINWTNQCFGGMPTYQLAPNINGNVMVYVGMLLSFWQGILQPHFLIFLMMLAFFASMRLIGVDWKLAAAGALGYSLLTYNILLIEGGHVTKVYAMAWCVPMFSAAYAAYRGRWLAGGILFAFFAAGQLYANHLQITYYTLLLLGLLGLIEGVFAIRNKQIGAFAKASAFLVAGGLLALAVNLKHVWSTKEYAAESIRGKSELTSKNGLDKGYVFEYTPSVGETFSMLVPDLRGGTSRQSFASEEGSATDEVMQTLASRVKNQEQMQQLYQAATKYWGGKPMTTGPVYFGAIMFLLFMMGMVLIKGPLKWWAAIGTVFFIMLSWGDNFPAFNLTMFKYFPMYNKFRDVSTTLNVLQGLFAMTAIYALMSFFKKENDQAKRLKAIYIGAGISLGICVILLLWSFVGVAEAEVDKGLKDAQLNDLVRALRTDRMAALRADVLRSILFILLGAVSLFAYAKNWIRQGWVAVSGVILFSLIDIIAVNGRYITEEQYKEKSEVAEIPKALPVDNMILKDPDPYYRVLDVLRDNPLAGSEACFYHKSIGGYFAAKLGRYQEFASRYILDMEKKRFSFPQYMELLGMMNVKYIISDQNRPSIVPTVLGNAWFPDTILHVADARAELDTLATLRPKTTATLMDKYCPEELKGVNTFAHDSTDYIKLTSYHPHKLTYEYSTSAARLAVFSEIFYPTKKGWKLYIDNAPVNKDIAKVNYLLRGAMVPAGKHTVEMRFEPKSISQGGMVTMLGSVLLLLALGLLTFFGLRKKPEATAVDPEELEMLLPEKPEVRVESRKPAERRTGKK